MFQSNFTIDAAIQACNGTLDFIPDTYNKEQIFPNIVSNSNEVTPGALFIAVSGATQDGSKYIPSALEKGAKLIVSTQAADHQLQNLLQQHQAAHIVVAESRHSTAQLAMAFYQYPAEQLKIVGVTGTNGKTTTATLLYRLFTKLGYATGLIGTIENCFGDVVEPSQLTTPGPIALQQMFRRMSDAGCKYVFMEVSSHALDQHRVEGIRFAGAIFTNLTRDHLDYHKDMKQYQDAKKRLFDGLDADAFALINADDKHASYMVQNTAAHIYKYALQSPADYTARIVERDFEGTELNVNGKEVWIKLAGLFNVYNALAVWSTAALLLPQIAEQDIWIAISSLHQATGRFQVIRGNNRTAIVDYAHTPDALNKVLTTIQQLMPPQGRIITVVGAGGNRDAGKRPLMAQEAFSLSRILILTSDNPRNEDPQNIINDMLQGIDAEQQENVLCIVDRKEAIRTALTIAQQQDVVLVAGKGHETYQEIQGVRHHFDDAELIKSLLHIE